MIRPRRWRYCTRKRSDKPGQKAPGKGFTRADFLQTHADPTPEFHEPRATGHPPKEPLC